MRGSSCYSGRCMFYRAQGFTLLIKGAFAISNKTLFVKVHISYVLSVFFDVSKLMTKINKK